MSWNIVESKVILDIRISFFMPLVDRQPLLMANMNCTIANSETEKLRFQNKREGYRDRKPA